MSQFRGWYRVQDGIWQLPIYTLKNEQTKRTLLLVSVMHIGTLPYFELLASELEKFRHEGGSVLYEGIGPDLVEDHGVKRSEHEQSVLAFLNFIAQYQIALAEGLGLVHQYEALYKARIANWYRADMSLKEFLSTCTADPVFMESASVVRRGLQGKDMKLLATQQARQEVNRIKIHGPSYFLGLDESSERNLDFISGPLLVRRNERALEEIRRHLQNSNVATIWGARHLEHLFTSFVNEGFRLSSVGWVSIAK